MAALPFRLTSGDAHGVTVERHSRVGAHAVPDGGLRAERRGGLSRRSEADFQWGFSWPMREIFGHATYLRSVESRPQHLDEYTVSVYRVVMIQSFADRTTADVWAQLNTKAARRIPVALWPVVHRKLTMLDSAQRLEDLAAVPGNRLGALAGDREGQHSIRVNQQDRVTFRWERKDAYDVCCEDYH